VNWFARHIPVIRQSAATECGLACVAMIASYYGMQTDLTPMRQRLTPSMKGLTFRHIAALAESMNLATRGVKISLTALTRLKVPAILHWEMNHFVVLTKVSNGKITIHDPELGRCVLKMNDVSEKFTGAAMELTPTASFAKGDERAKVSTWQLVGSTTGVAGTMAQVLLLSLVLEVLTITSPFFVQVVVDRVITSRDRDLLSILGIGFSAIAIAAAVVTGLRAWLAIYISTSLSLQLFERLFSHLLSLPLEWFEKRHIGDIMSRFRSLDTVQKTLTLTFLETAIDGVMVLITLFVMAWYSTNLFAIVVVVAAIYGAMRCFFYAPQRQSNARKLYLEAKAGTHFIETLRGMMAIKLNVGERERRSSYLNHLVDQINADVIVQKLGIAQRSITILTLGLGNVALIWMGGTDVLNGELTAGMLFAFLGFQLIFVTRVQNLIDKAIEFRMLDLHTERIADIALSQTELRPVSKSAVYGDLQPGKLSLWGKNLGFRYGVEGFVFRGVDFSVRPGELVAIVGPSGSGKSTLVKVLAGLLDRTEGELKVNDSDIHDWDPGHFRGKIGVVAQEDYLFVGTIEENICFFDPEFDPARVREVAQLAKIDREIESMPMGYQTLVGSLGTALSGGQKQRVLLARALYKDPLIVFLDESFDQLELESEQQIIENLRAVGLGLVLVSHRPDTIRSVDRATRMG
jgi:ATP-binding cassette, subfamily B, bacterial CvaB/MchF/RaxB